MQQDVDWIELQLKTICPHADEWPNEYIHQKVLRGAVSEARDVVRRAYAELDAVEANRDLSSDGKRRHKAKIVSEAIAKLEDSKTPARVAEAVTQVTQKWEQKISANIKPASDAQQIAVHAQIRDRLASMKKEDRISFLEKNGSDLTLISAVLTAPAYLSGLTDVEHQFIKQQLERLAPREIIEARAATQKALDELNRGWRAAIAKLSARSGPQQGCR